MPSSEMYDEKRVLEMLATGSEYAFTQVFDHYKGKVYSVAVKFLKSPIQAEEIVQDLFLKIWLKREEMAGIRSFDNYLFIMARNMIFDRIKKLAYEVSKQKNFSAEHTAVSDTDHLVEDKQYQKMLLEAIETLSGQQKQVYKLAKMEGLTREQIAEQLNISPLTVKTHLSRAMESIRIHLSKNISGVYITLLITAINEVKN